MDETDNEFTAYYRRRVSELEKTVTAAKTAEELEKIRRELLPYLKQIGGDGK